MSNLKIEDIRLGQYLEWGATGSHKVTGIRILDGYGQGQVCFGQHGWVHLSNCSEPKSLGQVLYEMLYPTGNYNIATNVHMFEAVAMEFKKYLDAHLS